MKKFYHKKDLPIEESPLTLQLQRRHTVVESDKDSSAVVPKLRPVSRSNSTSSIYRPPKSAKDLSSQKGYLESTLSADTSKSSSASTVVITECQLSSSWLYNNKKAQMRSNEAEPAGEPSSQQASDNEEGKYPSVHRSKVKSVSSPNGSSRKGTSCCCYAAIVILAVVAVIGIITTIGGIIYMEFFSGSNKTLASGSSEIGQSEDLSYKKKIGYLLEPGKNYISKDLMPKEEEIMDSSSESKQELEVLSHFKEPKSDNVENKQGSGNILRVKKVKDVVPITETDISDSLIQKTSDQKLPEESNRKRSFPFVVPSFGRSDSPYSKLFELYKGIRTALTSSLEESSSSEEDKKNQKISDLTDSKAEISDLTENNGSDFAHHQEIDSDSTDSLKESLKPESKNEDTSKLEHQLEIESEKELPPFDASLDSKKSLKPDLMRIDTSELEHQHGIEIHEDLELIDKPFDSNDSLKESLIPDSINRDDSVLNNQHDIENDKDIHVPDMSFGSNDSSNVSLKPDLDIKLEVSSTPVEVLQPAVPKYFFRRPTEGTGDASRNTVGINEGGDDTNVEVKPSVRRFLPLVPISSDVSNHSITGELSVKNHDASFDSKDSINREINSEINASHVPSGEVLGPAIPKNFFQLPHREAGLPFRNMLDNNERSDAGNPEEQSFPRFLPHIPQLSDPNDANENIVSNLDESNQESDLPLELNRPVSEAKIAFPGPLDLLRRFTVGRESDKKDDEAEQQDRRFSLAQALERLRTLDVRNVLPSSRQKTDSKKKPKPNFVPKVQNEQEVVTERSTYLQKLRRRFFDQ